MKLFKSLLIAPATLGLLAPVAATANEVTISDFAPSEQLAITNSRVDGLEARMNNIEAGSFSETTKATFGVNFYAGFINDDNAGDDLNDNLTTGYDFNIGLSTTFTGEDSLDIELEAGHSDSVGIAEFDTDNTTNEALTVDEISYTFPLGDNITVMVGDNKDASSLFTTACVYGGPTDTLDACGNVNAAVDNGGVMAGASYDFGNGLTAAVGYAGSEDDVANEEGADAIGFNVAYTGDAYGVSFTYGALEDNAPVLDNMGTDFAYALNAYWTPDSDGLPSISLGYEYGEDDSAAAATDEYTNIFAGLQWDEFGPGTLGLAMGTRVNTVEDTDAQYQYEAFYDYPLNDNVVITPVLFVKDISTANTDDTTGVMVRTSFSF